MNTQRTLGQWIRVKRDNYVKPTEEVEVGVFISPYDIPDGVRGGFDKDIDRFVVEFRYMVDEEYRRLEMGNGVCLRLGKHSSRIVGIEIDVGRLRASKVTVAVETDAPYAAAHHAIRDVENVKNARARRRENYLVAQRVLEDKHDAIFGNMHHVAAG